MREDTNDMMEMLFCALHSVASRRNMQLDIPSNLARRSKTIDMIPKST